LVASRGDGEHEASRRLKTELFSEMDGIASSSCQSVMLLATTNCPWDLDEAMRRRLEKRIYIPLPDLAARAELFEICMRSVDVDSQHVSCQALAASTIGYSGADIRIVCREAAMMPMRRLLLLSRPEEIQRMRAAGELHITRVQLPDFMTAIQNTSPSVSSNFDAKYLNWDKEYGSR
jgi:katanin p60 ATPase-containing subunit A1